MSDILHLLNNKGFVRLWLSQIFSQFAVNVLIFLFIINIYQQTNSSIAVSVLWIIYSLPTLFVGPFSSAFVDISNKRHILIVSNLLQFILLFVYALFYTGNIYFMYFTAFSYSLLNQFYIPAELSSLPNLVEKKSLAYANSLFFFTQQSAVIFGYGLSGLINYIIGFKYTNILCASMLLMAFFSVYKLPDMKIKQFIGNKIDDIVKNYLLNIQKGYGMIRKNKNILLPISLMLMGQSALVVITVNTPFITEQMFKVNSAYSGLVIVIPASLGAAISGLYISKRIKQGIRKKKIVLRALFLLSILLMLSNLIPYIADNYSRIIFGIILIALVGGSFVQLIIPSNTFLQESTPENFRGRVFGNFWVLSTLITFLPIMISATFVESFGIKSLLMFLSIVCLIVFYIAKKDKHSLIYE